MEEEKEEMEQETRRKGEEKENMKERVRKEEVGEEKVQD